MCCPLQLPEGTTYDLDPLSPEASDYLWNGDYAGHKNVALELTHNYGTEALEGPVCEKNVAPPSRFLCWLCWTFWGECMTTENLTRGLLLGFARPRRQRHGGR